MSSNTLRSLLTALDTVERDTLRFFGCGWVGFNRAFEASEKPGSALRITSSLVFFSINLVLKIV